jgi:Family of unknown function (DUF5906)
VSRKKKDSDSEEIYTNEQLTQHVPPLLESPTGYPGLPKLPRRFARARLDDGTMRVLEVFQDDVVRFADVSEVADTLATWARCNETHERAGAFALLKKSKIAKEHADNWLANYSHNATAGLPRAVRFKSEEGRCFHRLPFDLLPESIPVPRDVFPAWSSVLDRISNAEAFAMRVASLFDQDASRRQIVWLSGPANCGKSVVLDAIAKLMGAAYTSLDPSSMKSNFWKSTLVGKRLAVVNEATPRFLKTPAFKAVTGDDLHLIDAKYKGQFTARIEPIFFFASNDLPTVPGDDAVLSRIIDCRIAPVPAEERERATDVRERLWEEMPEFLSWAWHLYRQRVGVDGTIPASTDTLLEAVAEFEGDAMDFLAAHFVREEGAVVLASRVDELLRNAGRLLNDNEKGEWKAAWERAGVSQVRTRTVDAAGERRRVFKGIRERRGEELVVRFG